MYINIKVFRKKGDLVNNSNTKIPDRGQIDWSVSNLN